jgi:hypothetical protein
MEDEATIYKEGEGVKKFQAATGAGTGSTIVPAEA